MRFKQIPPFSQNKSNYSTTKPVKKQGNMKCGMEKALIYVRLDT